MAPSTLRQWSPSVCGRPTLYPLKPYFYTFKTYFIYPHTGLVCQCVCGLMGGNMLEYGGACRVECLGPRGTSTKSMTGSRLRVCLSVSVSVQGASLFIAERNWNIHWNAVSTQSLDNACAPLCKPRCESTLPINNGYTLHSIVYTRAHPYFIIDYFFSHTQLCIPRYHWDVTMNVPIAFEVNKHLPHDTRAHGL